MGVSSFTRKLSFLCAQYFNSIASYETLKAMAQDTDVFSLSPTIQELLRNSRDILEHNKNLQKEIVSLRFKVDRQAGEISALNDSVKGTQQLAPEQLENDTMLSRKEAAKLLDVHLSSLYRWENSRQLVPIRLGGKIYYSKRKIEEILNK